MVPFLLEGNGRMSVYTLFFSPTGGTKNVVDLISSEFEVDAEVDLSVPGVDYSTYSFAEGDICFIGLPSFYGRAPLVALERLQKMKAAGTLAVLIVAYGNRAYDDTLLELKNETLACGFHVVAAVAAVAQHSVMRQFGEGRPDLDDKKQLAAFACQLKALIDSGKKIKDVPVPGKEPYRKYGVALKPKAGENCTACGLCAELCPVGAIPPDNPAATDEQRCISCMRCIAVCPDKARYLDSDLLMAATEKLKEACSGRKENELFLGVVKYEPPPI